MTQADRLSIISQALWIRNNSAFLSKAEIYKFIAELDSFGVFSVRQLANIVDNKISSTTLGRYLPKQTRLGGKLNPKSLEDILECFIANDGGSINYRLVRKILTLGTSQNMLARLTGIPQSTISMKVNSNGLILS